MTGGSLRPANSLADLGKAEHHDHGTLHPWWSWTAESGYRAHNSGTALAFYLDLSASTFYARIKACNAKNQPLLFNGHLVGQGPPPRETPVDPSPPRIRRRGDPLLRPGHITHASGRYPR